MIFSIGIEFLMGRAIMARWEDRDEPEWPPNPDRLFMALVSAWGETGRSPSGEKALRCLEKLGAPAISYSEMTSIRTTRVTYVPVNDKTATSGLASGTIPIPRTRQPRTFPAIIPERPEVFYSWAECLHEEDLGALENLLLDLTYLGHSSSPVRAWIERNPPEPMLFPSSERVKCTLRIFGPGRLDNLKMVNGFQKLEKFLALEDERQKLEDAYSTSRGGEKKLCKEKLVKIKEEMKSSFPNGAPNSGRSQPWIWQGYGRAERANDPVPTPGPYEPSLIVLRQIGGRTLTLESCGMLSKALRGALMSRFGPNAPEWLSGHQPDGQPSKTSRPAIIPLGFCNREHSDGHLLGCAIAIPHGWDETGDLLALLGKHDGNNPHEIPPGMPFLDLILANEKLGVSDIGRVELELEQRQEIQRAVSLKPTTWCKPSRVWASVTPLVLPKFPRRHLGAEEVVATALMQAGYPRPAGVRVGADSMVLGVPHVRHFHFPHRENRPPRPLIHALVEFDHPLAGPLIAGAGRHSGYGLFRPLS